MTRASYLACGVLALLLGLLFGQALYGWPSEKIIYAIGMLLAGATVFLLLVGGAVFIGAALFSEDMR